jgi:peptide-methionine (R)-S-oxide reductase
MTERKVEKTEEQWREELTEFEFHVLREAGTERAFTGELLNEDRKGTFRCRGCNAELFTSTTKFDSHCGWPSFYEPKEDHAVELREDNSHGMKRVEVLCRACGSHLGHVFEDGPKPTGLRFCLNSESLNFHETPNK